MNRSHFFPLYFVMIALLLGSCGVFTPQGSEDSRVIELDSSIATFEAEQGQFLGEELPDSEQLPFIDSDGDGLSDTEELQLGTDANNSDSDGDQLSDYDEINLYGTDPLTTDSDNDGESDYAELMELPDVYPDLPINPLNPDNDGDGFHPLPGQPGFPALADCDNLNPNVYPGAVESTTLDDVNLDCKPDVPTWEFTFNKGYHVVAEIVVISQELYNLKVYADHDTFPFENHGECRVLPDEASTTDGCPGTCATVDGFDDYLLQQPDGYNESHECWSWINGGLNPTVIGSIGFKVTRLSPVRWEISARGKQNNHNSPIWITVTAELGD